MPACNIVYRNQRKFYKKNNNLTSSNKKYISKLQERKRELLSELEVCKDSLLNWQSLLGSLAELSPFPIIIICLETNEILFDNQSFSLCFDLVFDKRISEIKSDIFVNPDLWNWLISQLKTHNVIKNQVVELKKSNGDIFAAQISAKTVNYEGKLAGLFLFMEQSPQINTVLTNAVQHPLQTANISTQIESLDSHIKNISNHTSITTLHKNTLEEADYQQLKTRLHLLERTLSASSNGIILTDAQKPNNPIIYVNPAFEVITGYCAAEVIGRNCCFLQGKQRNQTGVDELRNAIAQQRECHVVLQNYRKDGSLFWNELHIAPVFDTDGSLTHFLGVQTDITERIEIAQTLHKQQQQYRRIVETATEGIWVLNCDNQTTFVNKQMAAMLGYSIEQMLGKSLFCFMDSEGIEIANAYLVRRHQGIHERHDFKFRCHDGSELWTIISCAPLFDDQGNYVGALGMVTDITARKKAEAALQESKQRLDGILHSLEDVVWSISAATFETLYLNSAVEKIYGCCADDFFTNSNLWFEMIHPDDQARVGEAVPPLFETGSQEIEYRIIRPDGQVRWLFNRSHLIYDTNGQAVRIEGIATDITERKLMEEKLIRLAFYDVLTGLPNRALFMDKLQQTIARGGSQSNDLFAVLFLDLDRFKVVNDSLGHLVGDQLLMALAERLQSCLQPQDTLARWGGDEFTILLPQIESIEDATVVAENIHQALKSPFKLSGYEVFSSASIGIALGTDGCTQAAHLLRDADSALYRAKADGKARHTVFQTTMYTQALALLHLETDLRWAIERQQLQILYQPIVCVSTGKITGFEALVRWQHPVQGLIPPSKFIPLAEETGLIIPIGEWILRQSCYQLRQWQLKFPELTPLSISVNLSSKQFIQPDLVQQIAQILQEISLLPNSLKLEITESAIMDNPEKAATILGQLKAFGIQLCIDDFGTGYSSLAYLHQFPIDVLKVDRSFINRIDIGDGQLAIVRAIITLAKNLSMSVVAEGVESLNQLAQLRLLQCEQAQGYLFSQPLNSQDIDLLLTSQPCFCAKMFD
ncbi:diguanylate cyclase/phosphodiesterase with PAS/PAC and GAF sensor(s) (plasmid) [Nostoc sp. HK-01]|nr:diguanylate cyclase/phosphodiesterase with PAS/PAC and GAF sensor(s) [Nostoc sp. HK-01]